MTSTLFDPAALSTPTPLHYAEVHILDTPLVADKPYTYEIPPHLTAQIQAGSLVHVPFGRGSRVVVGLVTALVCKSEVKGIKPILSLLWEEYHLTDDMLGMVKFLADHTLCTIGEATRAVLPPGLLDRHVSQKNETTVYPQLTKEELEGICNGAVKLHSEAHHAVLQYFIRDMSAISQSRLCDYLHITPAQIKPLVKRGYLAYGTAEVQRNPYELFARQRDTSPIYLSRSQMAASEQLQALYEENKPKAALLFGVTGSGKTKVMLHLIDRVIKDGKQVIMMVPEIALTPQTVSIFCRRYGTRVAVVHSALSVGERFDAWRRILAGEVDLVIGTRSAVFAPLQNIGVIIIDEEHEHTYKSESDPKYHARDVAAYRCGKHNALMVLASATPSFESYYKAKEGRYALITLKERYGGATLPDTEIVDMRQEVRSGKITPFSTKLLQRMEALEEKGEQAILFLNRRGYNSSLQCKSCGEAVLCPHCSVTLTYHTAGRPRLQCHCCGFVMPVPHVCPSCQSEHLSFVGFGTQKAETQLSIDLPSLRVMRMDADTTTGKQSFDRMLEGFRAGEADVLLGTQMVTKGHDFPRVTLVGVLLADLSLYVSDFRAAERTFSLLTQVIGRAGRSSEKGVAVIQTFAPFHEVIRYACAQDYESFYASEIALRRQTMFPPFCDLVSLTLTSSSEKMLFEATAKLRQDLELLAKEQYSDLPLVAFGPFEAGIYKVAEKYRMQMMVKCRLNTRTKEMFRALLLTSATQRDVTVSIDFNPQ